ncbi:MAG: radical SAM family heme chaperone HemW [Planctomycetes bacterium]|nr:radical SAM family heme chaperone HemW [Planctomycetota bacterium]MBI3848269.1 radical SAM family heme chaperone HemW [Planctomycetota bacterium]
MTGVGPRPRAFYVHLPFCVVKCPYCDFYSVVERGEPIDEFLGAFERELASRAHGLRPETIFVGGGTPSFLSIPQTERFLSALHDHIDFTVIREFTVESNPESVNVEKVRLWRGAGATRFSVGVQSFRSAKLAFLGRAHDADDARRAVDSLREEGCNDVNLDLMFGVPGETPNEWAADLREAIALAPDHVSAYGLTIEPGTEFGRLHRDGVLCELDESTWCEMFDSTRATLSAAGYAPYEISNFARPGRECRHNLVYWNNAEYVGVGPSAVSYENGVRRRNVAEWRKYVAAVRESGHAVVFEEALQADACLGESLMLGLRLERGVSRTDLRARFGIDIAERFAEEIVGFMNAGLLSADGDRIALTDAGRRVANSVIEAFIR